MARTKKPKCWHSWVVSYQDRYVVVTKCEFCNATRKETLGKSNPSYTGGKIRFPKV